MIVNYLAAGPAIIARLKDQVPELRAVYPAAELAAMKAPQQTPPCAHVTYEGDRVPTGDADRGTQGLAQRVHQRWMVVVVTRNVRQDGSPEAAQQEAGPLVAKVIAALGGWPPTADFQRGMLRVAGPRPVYQDGFAYFPLLYELQLFT